MTQPSLKLPPDGSDCLVVASVSGGKDSTALILALREAEITARYVFADTQWEAPETYKYLDLLRDRLNITIDVVGAEGGMMGRSRHRARFPGRQQRFCTRELKLQPLRAYHDGLEVETISAMGVRADESQRRAQLPEWEDDDQWGGYVWRPLIRWSITDVLEIHRRHNIPVNPLYRRGFSRVGCYPCIFANKEEIRLIAESDPGRIDALRNAETEIDEIRKARGYDKWEATFFQTIRKGFSGIDEVVSWAKTDRGGRQFPLFSPAPRGGCMRWGLCDTGADAENKDDPE